MDMDGDWPLPRPAAPFRTRRRKSADAAPANGRVQKRRPTQRLTQAQTQEQTQTHEADAPPPPVSIASTFSSLVTPVATEAVYRVRELAAAGDAETFHQLRVAFRKLRALYWAYSPYLGEAATAKATEEFRRLAAVAGGTRDWDIVGDLLGAAHGSGITIEPLEAAAREKREQAAVNSRNMIRSDEVEAFLNDVLLETNTALRTCCDDLPAQGFALKRVRQAKRTLEKRSRRVVCSKAIHEEALHDVRKAGKKLRYLLEFFGTLTGDEHGHTVKALTSVQNRLGQFNDIAASQSLVRSATFDAVPAGVLQDFLQWLEQQKHDRMRAASRQVQKISGKRAG
jgi:CHAD domain-containing protein